MVKRTTKTKTKTKPQKASGKKHVYFFGNGKADGNRHMKDLLGGKGSGLAEMTNAGLPVPPGFTISTDVCTLYYDQKGKIPPAIDREIEHPSGWRNGTGTGIESAAAKRRVDGGLERRLELRAARFGARVAHALVPGGGRIGDVGRHAVELVGAGTQPSQRDVMGAGHCRFSAAVPGSGFLVLVQGSGRSSFPCEPAR